MRHLKTVVSFLLLVVAVASFGAIMYSRREVIGKKYLRINNTDVFVEVVATPQDREKGLSGHAPLAQNEGMLFIFDEPKRWSFWMQGMTFGLDFIWINDNKVIDLHENVKPPMLTDNNPEVLSPRLDVRYVLEVNEGWISKNNVKIGDLVEFHI